MNANLAEVLKIYSTGSENFCAEMGRHSKPAIIGILSDLLTLYINDRNSSTIREYLTVLLAGYKHRDTKIGYNGYKTEAGCTVDCEVKPKNIRQQDFLDYEQGRRSSKPTKLSGAGNFTDYTWQRFDRDKKSSPQILASGFIDGRLLYILEFPFGAPDFLAAIERQLKRHFPKGDVRGIYLRSASFSYKDYMGQAVLRYREQQMEQFEDFLVGAFYKQLMGKAIQCP